MNRHLTPLTPYVRQAGVPDPSQYRDPWIDRVYEVFNNARPDPWIERDALEDHLFHHFGDPT